MTRRKGEYSKSRLDREFPHQVIIPADRCTGANGAVIENRNAADSAFVIARGLDPVAANDFATKNYVDTGTLGGAIREVRFATAQATGVTSAAEIRFKNAALDYFRGSSKWKDEEFARGYVNTAGVSAEDIIE